MEPGFICSVHPSRGRCRASGRVHRVGRNIADAAPRMGFPPPLPSSSEKTHYSGLGGFTPAGARTLRICNQMIRHLLGSPCGRGWR